MEAQELINAVFGIAGLLGGIVISMIRQSVKELHDQDIALADKVSSIEVLVAGTYVKRDELDRLSSALFQKLDRIENKLDGKADKGA